MLPLGLFRIRNFWVTNLTTLSTYAGLIGGALLRRPLPPADRRLLAARGRPGDDADLDPDVLPLAALRPDRLGDRAAAADERRARSSAGVGLLLLLRVGADPGLRRPTSCPALLIFGVGLSATVAPLTATVLDSVDEHHVGHRLGRQQRRLPRRRAAGDRGPRRRDLGQLRRQARRRAGRGAALRRRDERRSPTRRKSRSPCRNRTAWRRRRRAA